MLFSVSAKPILEFIRFLHYPSVLCMFGDVFMICFFILIFFSKTIIKAEMEVMIISPDDRR